MKCLTLLYYVFHRLILLCFYHERLEGEAEAGLGSLIYTEASRNAAWPVLSPSAGVSFCPLAALFFLIFCAASCPSAAEGLKTAPTTYIQKTNATNAPAPQHGPLPGNGAQASGRGPPEPTNSLYGPSACTTHGGTQRLRFSGRALYGGWPAFTHTYWQSAQASSRSPPAGPQPSSGPATAPLLEQGGS